MGVVLENEWWCGMCFIVNHPWRIAYDGAFRRDDCPRICLRVDEQHVDYISLC